MAGPRQNRDFLTAVRAYVHDAFAAAGNRLVPVHLERTLAWLRELAPQADEALEIAALAHDIERAFREEEVYVRMFNSADAFRDPEFLAYHQSRSSGIIGDYLESLGCPDDMRRKVCRLVGRHEVGGDSDSDLLKDADSLSFFENNVELFVTVKCRESSPAKVRTKFDWMFSRITSARARDLCRPLYEAAVARLEMESDRLAEAGENSSQEWGG